MSSVGTNAKPCTWEGVPGKDMGWGVAVKDRAKPFSVVPGGVPFIPHCPSVL